MASVSALSCDQITKQVSDAVPPATFPLMALWDIYSLSLAFYRDVVAGAFPLKIVLTEY